MGGAEHSRRLSEAQGDEVARKYREGKGAITVEMLAAQYGCSITPIRNALKKRGVRRVGVRSVHRVTSSALNGRIT